MQEGEERKLPMHQMGRLHMGHHHPVEKEQKKQDGDCRVDVDEPPGLPRRCALEARSHFPPTQGPEEEDCEEIPPAKDLMDLTQRTEQCKL